MGWKTAAGSAVVALLCAYGCGVGDKTEERGGGDPGSGEDAGNPFENPEGPAPMFMQPDAGPEDAGSDAMAGGCGDGLIQPGEHCDDGNSEGGDGCASECDAIEEDFACPETGEACVSTVRCGDGRVSGEETCDDDNRNDGDGCTRDCEAEDGWVCPKAGARCEAAECGDGLIAGHEECEDDDSTPADADGCSATCKLEPGYVCDSSGGACRETVCNDGVKEGSEPCDDGDQVVGDGCNPFCEVEPDCSGGACSSRCGDGLMLSTDDEECDDGNTLDGDGCSSDCEVEKGYDCEIDASDVPDPLQVPVTYRDFIAIPTGVNVRHPDFESAYDGAAVTPGLVLEDLGADGKPVYADHCDNDGGGTCPEQQQLTTGANFAQWYNDTPGVNFTVVTRLPLPLQPNGSYFFPDASFFPLDAAGFVASLQENTSGATHNFGFTTEIRYWFELQGGEVLSFSGDDDVWVFIGGKLALDLGGLHGEQPGTVTLDDATIATLGLEIGNIYEIALFHAERHTNASNFNLTLDGFTSSKSVCTPDCGDGIIAGEEQCDDGDDNGDGYGECTEDCERGPYCGDGDRQKDDEDCDDGVNLTPYDPDGDGCAPGCEKPRSCGDGTTDAAFGEECDDGDNEGGYGKCEPDCTLGPRCGDGKLQEDQGEECDDKNRVKGDNCDDECQSEGPE